jgi:hypothetical protein
MRGNLLAKQFPGAAVLRGGFGEDGLDDSRCLVSDSGRIGGMLSTGRQIIGILGLGASWAG